MGSNGRKKLSYRLTRPDSRYCHMTHDVLKALLAPVMSSRLQSAGKRTGGRKGWTTSFEVLASWALASVTPFLSNPTVLARVPFPSLFTDESGAVVQSSVSTPATTTEGDGWIHSISYTELQGVDFNNKMPSAQFPVSETRFSVICIGGWCPVASEA